MANGLTSVSVGNAGEHLVMAELLARGFQTFMADRGNPAFDIAVDVRGRTSMIRVKTARKSGRDGDVIWSCKADGCIFLDVRNERDFVAIVDMRKPNVRESVIYIVPTKVVATELARNHKIWLSHPGRGGRARKDATARVIRLEGRDRPDNPTFGYGVKWSKYKEAWDQLGSAR